MGTPPDRGRALRPVRRQRPAPWWGTGAGLAAVSTERAAHPVQVHVAAGHEAQGQRRHGPQSATSGGRVPTATGCWEWTHTAGTVEWRGRRAHRSTTSRFTTQLVHTDAPAAAATSAG